MRRKTRPVHSARRLVRKTLGFGAHDLQQCTRRPPAHRGERPARTHASCERRRLFAIQLEQLPQAAFQRVGRHEVAKPPRIAPPGEDAKRKIEAAPDALAPQRLDSRIRNVELHGQAARAREELAIDLARPREQSARVVVARRAPGGQKPGGAIDRLRVLADLLGDVRLKQRLKCREREAQRQRLAQPAQRAAVELPEQPRVQARENARTVQRGSGFTAR